MTEKLANARFLGKYNARKRNRESYAAGLSTHTSMIGGAYAVSLEVRRSFYEEYFNEFSRWLTGCCTTPPTLFLTERYNGEYFRFYVDIDYKWTDTPPAFLTTIACVTKAVAFILGYMDDAFHDQSPLEVCPSERTDYKRHVVFPQVIVDHTKALLFAQAVQKHVNNNSDLDIAFDMAVYRKGSLRMLGSCKDTGLVSGNEKETEFIYMPVDLTTGERHSTITYEEFKRHTILLDKETTERVERFVALDDGAVCLPEDEESSALYVTSKYIHSTSESSGQRAFLSDNVVSQDVLSERNPIFQFIKNNYGESYARTNSGSKYIEWCETLIVSFTTRLCPFVEREHTGNHPYFILNRTGACMKCYSKKNAKCKERFNHIEFDKIDEETKNCFWEFCFTSIAKYIPEAILTSAKHACEENMIHFKCVSMDGDTEPLDFVKGKLVTRRKNCFYRCSVSDVHKDMIAETDANGTFLICMECGSRYPENSQGLLKNGIYPHIKPLFTLIEGFKNRGVSVFQDVHDTSLCDNTVNDGLLSLIEEPSRSDMNYSCNQVQLLQPEMYEDGLRVFDDDKTNNAFILSMTGADRDVALFMELQLGNDFIATSAEKGDWYYFNSPRWRGGEYAQNMLFLFVDNTVHDYVKAIRWYRSSNFSGKKSVAEERIRTIEKVKNKLGDIAFVKKVMSRLAHFRLDVNFVNQLDQNRSLLVFNDAVYDLDKFVVRDGEPEDKVSMTVGYDFPRHPDADTCAKILKFFDDIQPEKENRDYLKAFVSSLIDGRTCDELFHIFAGKTRNGKSVIADMIKMALGCHDINVGGCSLGPYTYAGDYEPSFLTKERKGSSDPVPDLLVNRLARTLIGLEPETGEKINTSNMKKLTGGDTMSGRMLHSNEMIHFKPQFKLILVCNDIPEMTYNDDAVWNRARVVDFPVTFVDNPTGPFERKIDRTFKEGIRNVNWASNFMVLLIEWHRTIYLPMGLKAPPSVLRATKQYEEESNVYLQWWNDNTVPSNIHISSKALLADFCIYTNKHNIPIKEFNKGLRQIHVNVKKSVRSSDGVTAGVEKRQLKTSALVYTDDNGI